MEEGIEKAGEQKHTGLGQVWAGFSERPAGRAQGVFWKQKEEYPVGIESGWGWLSSISRMINSSSPAEVISSLRASLLRGCLQITCWA